MECKSLDFEDRAQHLVNFSKAQCFKNVIGNQKLKDLREFMYRSTEFCRTSESGNVFFSGNFCRLIAENYELLNSFVDLSKVTSVRGNFFHTPHQYGFHTDMPEKEDVTFFEGDIAYKTILIPIFLLPKTSDCHIFFFKERLLTYGATLDKGSSKSQTHYKSYSNYENIDCLFDVNKEVIEYKNKPFCKNVFDEFNIGLTSPIERFDGFDIESVFQWTPGSAFVFDTSQLHMSNKGIGKNLFKTKAGLRISLWHNYRGKEPITFEDYL